MICCSSAGIHCNHEPPIVLTSVVWTNNYRKENLCHRCCQTQNTIIYLSLEPGTCCPSFPMSVWKLAEGRTVWYRARWSKCRNWWKYTNRENGISCLPRAFSTLFRRMWISATGDFLVLVSIWRKNLSLPLVFNHSVNKVKRHLIPLICLRFLLAETR